MDSSMLTLKEILDMRNTISDIDIFLAQIGLTEEKMRELKHLFRIFVGNSIICAPKLMQKVLMK